MPEWSNGHGLGPCGLVPTQVRTLSPAFIKMKTGQTNIHVKNLIKEIKKNSSKEDSGFWKKIGKELEKLRDEAWNACNHEEFKNMRKSWAVGTNLKIKENKSTVI